MKIITKIWLCSACLLGMKTRWDGGDRLNLKLVEFAKGGILIPICPEQLGGLSTPREPSEQKGKEVFTRSGINVTQNFIRGAEEVIKVARLLNVKEAILKQKSPSCGCGLIPDGTFSGKLIAGNGITTKLLKKHGIRVISEDIYRKGEGYGNQRNQGN